jgi:hypothetical protein
MIEKRMMVALVGAILLFSACVSQEKQSAAEVLNRSVFAMEKIETYSFAVKSTMLIIGNESVLSGGTQQVDLRWRGDVDGRNRRMHVTAEVASDNSTSISEQYIIGGRQYVKVPLLGWIMNETGEEFWDEQMYSKLQSNFTSVNPVLVGEEKINGVACYVLDLNLSSIEAFGSVMQQQGSTEGIKEIKWANMREWIAKDSFLLMRSETKADIVGTGMEAYINTTIDFSGYNNPISIELPAEAENALDINQLMSGG